VKKMKKKVKIVEEEEKAGYISVTDGKILICDIRDAKEKWTNKTEQCIDVIKHPNGKMERVEHCNKRWFELIEKINEGAMEHIQRWAVVLDSGLKDGVYPVYVTRADLGSYGKRITGIRIDMKKS
jgi:hypothetical protein